MKIKFLEDYCGRETAIKQYKRGDIDHMNHAQAQELIRLGIATEDMGEELPPKPPRVKKVVKYDTDA